MSSGIGIAEREGGLANGLGAKAVREGGYWRFYGRPFPFRSRLEHMPVTSVVRRPSPRREMYVLCVCVSRRRWRCRRRRHAELYFILPSPRSRNIVIKVI
jgi:hypothetical protein